MPPSGVTFTLWASAGSASSTPMAPREAIRVKRLFMLMESSCYRSRFIARLEYFEQAGRPHPAADAHRHDDELRAAALAFDQGMACKPRARHAVRVADGDRAAVDVEAVGGNAKLVAAVDHLHGEGLVQFPQADVLDLLAGLREALRHRERRADAHLVGLAAGGREAAEDPQRLRAALGDRLVAHHHASRCAIGELARVAGGDHTARERRLDLRDTFVCGVGANPLVRGERDLLGKEAAGILVTDAHP